MEWAIGELARRAGVTRRTIRYYVEIGLLPPPSGAGKAAAYGPEHLERLAVIKELQSLRLSLEEIREQLAGRAFTPLTAATVRPPAEMPRSRAMASEPLSPAADYIAALRQREQFRMAATSEPGRGQTDYDAEPWVRVSISPDVELHVRRRGSRSERWLSRLISEARKILEEEKEVK